MPKKTRFVATSPLTGKEYTRSSNRAYTHACVVATTVDAHIRSELRAAERARFSAQDCRETAQHLRAGTTPPADSILHRPVSGTSWNEQKAGVRTEWQATLYRLANPIIGERTAESYAADHDGWAADSEASAERHEAKAAELRATGTPSEGASFHHSAALAAMEAAKWSAPDYIVHIVPVEVR